MTHDKDVYMIFDRDLDQRQGAYSRAYHTEYEFSSADDARRSNCHDIYQAKHKYRIAKYRVTYELIDPDCDCPDGPPDPPPKRELAPIEQAAVDSWKDAIKKMFKGHPNG